MQIGIDLGGTKIEGIVLDAEGGVRARKRMATPRGYEPLLGAVVELVHELETQVGQTCSVGLGTPGAASPVTGLHRNANNVGLNGRTLQRDIETRLVREVRVENDANCFALSEAVDGAGAGARLVFGVIVGTGTGGGIVFDKQVWRGRQAIAGEWGHNPLPWPHDHERPGPLCYCGKFGCIETWLSGPGLARDHEAHTGVSKPAQSIAEAALHGDEEAIRTLERYEDRMARALATVIDVLDPDVIVLGGGLSRIERLYPHVMRALGRYVFSDAVSTPVVAAHHGDASGVRGAAWLWPAS